MFPAPTAPPPPCSPMRRAAMAAARVGGRWRRRSAAGLPPSAAAAVCDGPAAPTAAADGRHAAQRPGVADTPAARPSVAERGRQAVAAAAAPNVLGAPVAPVAPVALEALEAPATVEAAATGPRVAATGGGRAAPRRERLARGCECEPSNSATHTPASSCEARLASCRSRSCWARCARASAW